MADPSFRYVYNSQYRWWDVFWLRPDGTEVHFKICNTEGEARSLVAKGNEQAAEPSE